jgi:fatty-acyl-CoA synthase
VWHALCQDALCIGSSNTVLMVVPMFHANSWGLAFSCPLTGCRLVLPGPGLDGPSIYHLIATYKVCAVA